MLARPCKSSGPGKTTSPTISTVPQPVTSCMPAWTHKANCSPGGTAALRHPSKPFTTGLAFHLKPRLRSIPSTFPLSLFQISGSSSLSPNPTCPFGNWGSVDASGNQLVLSGFFVEAAHAAARDPVEFLLSTLGPSRKIDLGNQQSLDVGRRRRVIELAAEKSGWHQPLTAGRGRGIAP